MNDRVFDRTYALKLMQRNSVIELLASKRAIQKLLPFSLLAPALYMRPSPENNENCPY